MLSSWLPRRKFAENRAESACELGVRRVFGARTRLFGGEFLEKLPHFKAPKRILFVDVLPRNASGKILKRELRDRFADPRSA